MINDYHHVQIIYLPINIGHLNNEIFIGSWSAARDSFCTFTIRVHRESVREQKIILSPEQVTNEYITSIVVTISLCMPTGTVRIIRSNGDTDLDTSELHLYTSTCK